MSHPLKWLALAALERPEMPAFDDVAAWYAARYPDEAPLRSAGTTERLLTLSIGDYTAAVTLVPRPMPWSQLEGPCAMAWYWPAAASALRRHEAHLLVTLIDEGGRAVDKAAALTRLTAAVVAASPAAGVLWGPGRLVHEPGAFAQQAAEIDAENLPLFLWVDFRIEALDDGELRLFTTGLEALGQVELEAPRYGGDAQSLLDHAYNVAHYMLTRRQTINDGDTIGLTDAVQVTARRGPSMLDGQTETLQLAFD